MLQICSANNFESQIEISILGGLQILIQIDGRAFEIALVGVGDADAVRVVLAHEGHGDKSDRGLQVRVLGVDEQ